ncbi:hypothetical protein ACIBI9_50440 [Nonomuraea sp. NPDC050451]|uniref:hypothetical protein n=1 Tax=Nonomuraea sp. NPDC050451 TaxID=3364364 RepID=UPI0037AB4F8D
MAESNGYQKWVVIRLTSMYCGDTLDMTGTDNVYFAGAVAMEPGSGYFDPRVIGPVEIHSRQKKMISEDKGVIFRGELSVDDVLEFGLVVRSTDPNESDFQDNKDTYLALMGALADDIYHAIDPLPRRHVAKGAVAGAILAATPAALVRARASLDKDEVLGILYKRVSVADYPDGRYEFTWKFGDNNPNLAEGGVVEWAYEISYTIDMGPAR